MFKTLFGYNFAPIVHPDFIFLAGERIGTTSSFPLFERFNGGTGGKSVGKLY